MAEESGQRVRQTLALLDQWEEAAPKARTLHDQGRLRHQKRIDMIEVEPRAHRHLDQGVLAGADAALTPQIVEEGPPPVE